MQAGSLAIKEGRDIAPTVNRLLTYPFALRLATRDAHPASHISFSANHPGTEPFTSTTTITHPSDPSRTYETTLWPVHCVQGTSGAALVPELDQSGLDAVVDKGKTESLEMYSAFYDPFRVEDTGLRRRLAEAGVTHVYVVGLAGEYCVKATAADAAGEGFVTYVVEEGTRCVDPGRWADVKRELAAGGVEVVPVDGAQVARVRDGGL